MNKLYINCYSDLIILSLNVKSHNSIYICYLSIFIAINLCDFNTFSVCKIPNNTDGYAFRCYIINAEPIKIFLGECTCNCIIWFIFSWKIICRKVFIEYITMDQNPVSFFCFYIILLCTNSF